MDDVTKFVNQKRFERTKAEDERKLEWGPTTHKITFRNKSLTTAVHNALKFVGKNGCRVVDTKVSTTPGFWNVVDVYYQKDQRIEDYNGEPCWLSDL